MEENQQKNGESKNQYQIKISPEIENGNYSNAISVSINQSECTVDFAFGLPNTKELKIVSRIIMNHKTAKSLVNVLSNAILDFENKQKKQQQ